MALASRTAGAVGALAMILIVAAAPPAGAQEPEPQVVLRYSPEIEQAVRYEFSLSMETEIPTGMRRGGRMGGGGRPSRMSGPGEGRPMPPQGEGGAGGSGRGGGPPGGMRGGMMRGIGSAVELSLKPLGFDPDGHIIAELKMEPQEDGRPGSRHQMLAVMTQLREVLRVQRDPAEPRPAGDADDRRRGASAVATPSLILGGFVLPIEPIAIGDSWEIQTRTYLPENDDPKSVGVKSRLEERLMDGDRGVWLIHTEQQVPLDWGRGDFGASGNMGVAMMLEIYEDTGDIRAVSAVRGQGSLRTQRGTMELRDIKVSLRMRLPSGDLVTPLWQPDEN